MDPSTESLSSLGERLLADVRDGAPGAWERMLDEFGEVVLAVPRRHGLGDDDAEDVFQLTWLALHRSLGRIRDPGALAAWILTTARRQTWRRLRERGRELTAEGAPPTPGGDGRPATPEQELLDAERGRLVRDGLAQLGDRCRDLLERLFFHADAPSYADIASALQVPIGSLGPTRRRCLARLAGWLEGHGLR